MTVHTFLAHFIYGEKGLTGQHLLHVDTLHHTIALSPYEKETAGTRFCDGILFVANASFEVCKPQIIAELKAKTFSPCLHWPPTYPIHRHYCRFVSRQYPACTP